MSEEATVAPQEAPTEEPTVALQENDIVGQQYEIPIDKISTNPDQPRKIIDTAELNVLIESIRENGLLQAIAVQPQKEGTYLIVAGERRYQAYKELGKKTIPARIVSGEVQDLALIENIIRSDLSAMERAMAMSEYMSRHNLKRHKPLAELFGLSKNSISEILSLNKLDKEIQDKVLGKKEYPLRKLVAIARKRDTEQQQAAFAKLEAKVSRSTTIAAVDSSPRFDAERANKRLVRINTELTKLMAHETDLPQLKCKLEDIQVTVSNLLSKTSV
ncbi:MAG: ParB/RepB/Spo0J family partition protein [Desulfovibrionaceae bacterium]|nr:ParB/RepB/Spo0J family partition protein [Desulfovibrionaceae bacterium]